MKIIERCCRTLIILLLMSATALYSNAQEKDYKTEKISDNIYSFISLNPLKDFVTGNVTAVIGANGICIIDTGSDGSSAMEIIKELKAISTKHVLYIVNTHWHPDHVMGNKVFKREYPDAKIISHTATKAAMIDLLPGYTGKPADSFAYYQALLKAGKYKDGTPLTALEITRYTMNVKSLERIINDIDDYEAILPDITFTDSLILDPGGITVKLISPGWAHTPGDVMVEVPSFNLLISGDVIVSPIPYAYDASLKTWIGILEKIEAMHPLTIIPGHGEIEKDLSYVKNLKMLLLAVIKEINAAMAKGLTVDQAVSATRLTGMRKIFAGDDVIRNAGFDIAFLEPVIRKEYSMRKK